MTGRQSSNYALQPEPLAPTLTGDPRGDAAVPLALQLVVAVRGCDPAHVRHVLERADLQALAVVLAGMVDATEPMSALLARVNAERDIKPGCGEPSWHSSHNRHRAHGETCSDCAEGERAYQAARQVRRHRASEREDSAA